MAGRMANKIRPATAGQLPESWLKAKTKAWQGRVLFPFLRRSTVFHR